MKVTGPISRILFFLIVAAATITAAERPYSAGTIVDVQTKTNTRILYYVVDTPVTKDEPYFEVSVRMKDTIYLGRYIPRHASDTLPDEWTPGATVAARLEGRHLILKRPSGVEMELAIVKHRAAAAGEQTAPHSPAKSN